MSEMYTSKKIRSNADEISKCTWKEIPDASTVEQFLFEMHRKQSKGPF
jgi:hypothetical protein